MNSFELADLSERTAIKSEKDKKLIERKIYLYKSVYSLIWSILVWKQFLDEYLHFYSSLVSEELRN